MDVEEYRNMFSKVRESIDLFISSIHYGHYKAVLEDDNEILMQLNLVF